MTKKKRPFASVLQGVIIVILLVSMLLVAQQFNETLYEIGMIMLIISTIIQIGASNISPDAGFGRSMKVLGISLLITAIVFFAGIELVPVFVAMGG